MTEQAALTIRAKDYDIKKFYVVVVVKPSDYDCIRMETIETFPLKPRIKELRIKLTQKISDQDYLLATFGAISIFMFCYAILFIVCIIYLCKNYRQKNGNGESLPQMEIERQQDRMQQMLTDGNSPSYGSINSTTRQRSVVKGSRKKETAANAESGSDSLFDDDDDVDNEDDEDDDDEDDDDDDDDGDSMINEDDIDMLHDAHSDKNVVRTKTFLYVADLARKNCKSLERKSKLYSWNMITVAVFYALPVIQLVLTFESILHVTGNEDICYYNFLCTYPLDTISDFNHVFSNIGYILLGFLFIGLVWHKDLMHKQKIALDDQYEKHYGIPRHFGLFYAMGLSLIMEGVLSGCYHVCPNYSNFQFDTSFMYMIGGLCMLKIYQTRHPDINASAYASFMVFAFVVLIAVIGVVYGSPIFWIVFAAIHVLSCLALSAQIYYMGRWKLNLGIFKRIYLTMKTDVLSERHCFKPMYMDRMLLLFFLNAVNWSFSVYGVIKRPRDFASYLLAIFIVNLLLYFAFYIIMKIRSGEKILTIPRLYIIVSSFTWSAALYFFFQVSTSWELTPAESRTYNKECLILNFYDDHDIWHFLSATSLFFSFMILLTLDDDLVMTPRDRIPVF